MSSPKQREVKTGDLTHTICDFAKKGDILEKHAHPKEADVHTVLFQRGLFTFQEWRDEGLVETDHDADADEGYFIVVAAGVPHAVIARSDKARSVHTKIYVK
jgi:quercetin dioxygenase-like cupin family protein